MVTEIFNQKGYLNSQNGYINGLTYDMIIICKLHWYSKGGSMVGAGMSDNLSWYGNLGRIQYIYKLNKW